MAARGSIAKEEVAKKIIECFGQDQAFIFDKKLYINTKENGEKIQICIAMTCPKNLVGVENSGPVVSNSVFSGGLDFENMGAATAAPAGFTPAEISLDEKATVQELMKRLGL